MAVVRKVTMPRDKKAKPEFVMIEIKLVPSRKLSPHEVETGARTLLGALSLIDREILRRSKIMPLALPDDS